MGKHIRLELKVGVGKTQAQAQCACHRVQCRVNIIHLALPGLAGHVVQGHGNGCLNIYQAGLAFKNFRFHPDFIQGANGHQVDAGFYIKALTHLKIVDNTLLWRIKSGR